MPFAPFLGTIRLRGTFIDLEERPSEEDIAATSKRFRSRSAPPSEAANATADDIFSEDRAYVLELCETYCGSGSPPDFVAEYRGAMRQERIDTDEAETVAVRERMDEEPPSFSALEWSSNFSRNISAVTVEDCNAFTSMTLLHAKGVDMRCSRDLDVDEIVSVTSTVASFVEGPRSFGPALEFRPLRACNLGSIGHPELCSRPCLHFSSGRCTNGTTCEFCHMPHDNSKKSVFLSKKHRSSLDRIPAVEAVEMLWPILREKVLSFDASPTVVEALASLAGQCPGSLEVAAADVSPRSVATSAELGSVGGEGTSLVRALHALSLRRVLLTLESVVSRFNSELLPGSGSGSDHRPAPCVAGAAEEASQALLSLLRDRALAMAP